ncbi:hypothetical protein M3Y99_00589500 [Aphelenchoides fujianensis]|nr:hypothetical protein M3Y99_00589500 [Aphelenchoides fujianensis]
MANQAAQKDVSTTFMLHQFPSHTWRLQNFDVFLHSDAQKVAQQIGPLEKYRLEFTFELSKAFGKRLRLAVVNGRQLVNAGESIHTSYLKIKLGLTSDPEWKEEFVLDTRSGKARSTFKLPKGAGKNGAVGTLVVAYAHELVVSSARAMSADEKATVADHAPIAPLQPPPVKSEREKLLADAKSATLPPPKPPQQPAGDLDAKNSTALAASDDEDERKTAERRANRANNSLARSKLDSERGSDWSLVNEKEDAN